MMTFTEDRQDFPALKRSLQRDFARLFNREGAPIVVYCQYCGEQRNPSGFVGVSPYRMCWNCFQNDVPFDDGRTDQRLAEQALQDSRFCGPRPNRHRLSEEQLFRGSLCSPWLDRSQGGW